MNLKENKLDCTHKKTHRGSGVFTECTIGKGTNLPDSTLCNGHKLHPSKCCQQVRTCFRDSRDTLSSSSLAAHEQSLITCLLTPFWSPFIVVMSYHSGGCLFLLLIPRAWGRNCKAHFFSLEACFECAIAPRALLFFECNWFYFITFYYNLLCYRDLLRYLLCLFLVLTP